MGNTCSIGEAHIAFHDAGVEASPLHLFGLGRVLSLAVGMRHNLVEVVIHGRASLVFPLHLAQLGRDGFPVLLVCLAAHHHAVIDHATLVDAPCEHHRTLQRLRPERVGHEVARALIVELVRGYGHVGHTARHRSAELLLFHGGHPVFPAPVVGGGVALLALGIAVGSLVRAVLQQSIEDIVIAIAHEGGTRREIVCARDGCGIEVAVAQHGESGFPAEAHKASHAAGLTTIEGAVIQAVADAQTLSEGDFFRREYSFQFRVDDSYQSCRCAIFIIDIVFYAHGRTAVFQEDSSFFHASHYTADKFIGRMDSTDGGQVGNDCSLCGISEGSNGINITTIVRVGKIHLERVAVAIEVAGIWSLAGKTYHGWSPVHDRNARAEIPCLHLDVGCHHGVQMVLSVVHPLDEGIDVVNAA